MEKVYKTIVVIESKDNFTIEDCSLEGLNVSVHLCRDIEFVYKGIALIITPYDTVEEVVKRYKEHI